ncbi:MAG: DNA polymerase domain-containing protein [Lentisphaeria bacterium]|nr:DNA polymerase domain-containing protein [Lentisphaeria bacterium]
MTESSGLDLEQLVLSSRRRLVSVEVEDDGTAVLFSRMAEDTVTRESVPAALWLLVTKRTLAEQLNGERVDELSGDGDFRFRVHVKTAEAYAEAGKCLARETGLGPSAPQAPYRLFNDFQQQALTALPARLFRGMAFGDLRRLQVDIETLTSPGYDFPNARRKADRIILIALRDSTGWETCLGIDTTDEKTILEHLVQVIAERDPDVIEGHNLFNFDLPYIETRCQMHKVPLTLGREGRPIQSRPSRFSAGERAATYRRYTAWGRHIVDTMHLAQLYDVSHRDLSGYGLKSVARHFGVAARGRTYVDGDEITDIYFNNPEKLRQYAMDDVRETDAVSAILSPSYFYQAQIVPLSYQNCVTRGSASRIDTMLVAEYMRADHALPRPAMAKSFSGGLTESFESGVFHNVWHVDVQSLYPSIIVSRGIKPATDSLGTFLTLLTRLRDFRLEAKKRMRTAATPEEKNHYSALQSSFKILINSFYGYLGFGMGTFNDFERAEEITTEGRRILTAMVDFLRDEKAAVIEIDTDGIYFVPPEGVTESTDFIDSLQTVLPPGIDVELDAVYQAMFSYKAKNYALLTRDGTVTLTGAALRSRGLESFQRTYIRQVIEHLLHGSGKEIQALKKRTRDAIERHELPLKDFAKRETLSTSPAAYKKKLDANKTRRSAAYELALRADRDFKQGDQVAFYVTGDKKRVAVTDAAKLLADADTHVRDENVPYYVDKLDKLHAKFAEFIPPSDNCDDLPLFET